MSRPLLMVIPTLGRPERLSQCLHSLALNGTGRHDLMTLDGDRWFYEKANAIPRELLAQYEMVGFIGNDCLVRTKAWDEFVLRKMAGRVGVLFGRDGIQNGQVCTAPFFSTSFCLGMGFVYPPGFHHYRGDRALCAITRRAGCLFYEPELYIEHLHYSVHKSKLDAVYVKGRNSEPRDEAVWQKYLKERLASDVSRAKAVLAKIANPS